MSSRALILAKMARMVVLWRPWIGRHPATGEMTIYLVHCKTRNAPKYLRLILPTLMRFSDKLKFMDR